MRRGAGRGAMREPRAWQRMLSGRRLDLLDPSPLDVELDDIAHGLARVARWNGQTSGPFVFSVAQHCLLVEAIADELGSQSLRALGAPSRRSPGISSPACRPRRASRSCSTTRPNT